METSERRELDGTRRQAKPRYEKPVLLDLAETRRGQAFTTCENGSGDSHLCLTGAGAG